MPRILITHQNANEQGMLYYNLFNGMNWEGEQPVPNATMSASPGLVNFNGLIYCFYQGYGNDGNLCYTTFNPANSQWDGNPQQVPNTNLSASPSAVAYQGSIYVFHQGRYNSGDMWYNTFDGSNWQGDQQVPNTGMSFSPAAVVFNNQIFVFHMGHGNSYTLWYNVLDGGNWQGDTQLQGFADIYGSPSAALWCSTPICIWQSGSDVQGNNLVGEYGTQVLNYATLNTNGLWGGGPTSVPAQEPFALTLDGDVLMSVDNLFGNLSWNIGVDLSAVSGTAAVCTIPTPTSTNISSRPAAILL